MKPKQQNEKDGMALKTERLTIRKFTAGDADDLYEYLSLPETYRFEPGNPITRDEARLLCAERAAGDCFYAVALRQTGKMIGHVYFARTEPGDFMTWELGYIFNPKFQNCGFCTEASKAMLAYGFTALRAHRVTAFCDPLNDASWHVLENIGLKREGHFKDNAFFRKDALGNPLWHESYAYGLIERDFEEK